MYFNTLLGFIMFKTKRLFQFGYRVFKLEKNIIMFLSPLTDEMLRINLFLTEMCFYFNTELGAGITKHQLCTVLDKIVMNNGLFFYIYESVNEYIFIQFIENYYNITETPIMLNQGTYLTSIIIFFFNIKYMHVIQNMNSLRWENIQNLEILL